VKALNKANFYPVILAGGRGTRFWPLSRKAKAKQLLALEGRKTMIQQTVARLLPAARAERFWVVTNGESLPELSRQVRQLRRKQIVAEPVGRNTASAIGLAAYILLRRDPEAVLGLFPSDHVIADEKKFRDLLREAVQLAAAGENIVTLGIQPTRPETGYGYIETGEPAAGRAVRVRRFTEKPDAERARQFLASGNYFWNSGMFIWGARTLANALREHLPETAPLLEEIAAAYGSGKFESLFRRLYPQCENISVDYAVLERRTGRGEHASNVFCIPAQIGWNDLGSWAALYEHTLALGAGETNVINGARSFTLNAQGNYVFAPKKFVAAVGVSGLVVVETEDALLITTREASQDVGKVVKYLDEKKLKKLV
jgi:mannose-1-phosphate guanylyltransferase